MILRAASVSFVLLLASRLLGLARESAQAAAFGTTGLADVVILMLTLPDWITGVLASGALSYVLLPLWSGWSRAEIAASQRHVARWLLAGAGLLVAGLAAGSSWLVAWLAPGVPLGMRSVAVNALLWSAAAVPLALLAALWVTRLQHERDVVGMYGANVIVNMALITAILLAGYGSGTPIAWLGAGLAGAMLLRLAWLRWRQSGWGIPAGAARPLPRASLWFWAAASAGLPLALPFAGRAAASQAGEGALATFNYAWKLVELPLGLAIQLVAALAFPSVARAFASGSPRTRDEWQPVRAALALGWTLACACAAALQLAAPALAGLVFGWGRMETAALADVAQWGRAGSWGLLPQSFIAVALTVLAAQRRMRIAVAAHALALVVLLCGVGAGLRQGQHLMWALNGLYAWVAVWLALSLGAQVRQAIPWQPLLWGGLAVLAAAGLSSHLATELAAASFPAVLATGAAAAFAVVCVVWAGSAELRHAVRR